MPFLKSETWLIVPFMTSRAWLTVPYIGSWLMAYSAARWQQNHGRTPANLHLKVRENVIKILNQNNFINFTKFNLFSMTQPCYFAGGLNRSPHSPASRPQSAIHTCQSASRAVCRSVPLMAHSWSQYSIRRHSPCRKFTCPLYTLQPPTPTTQLRRSL